MVFTFSELREDNLKILFCS